MEEIFRQISEYVVNHGLRLLLGICIVIVGFCLAWLIGFLIKKIFAKTRVDGAMLTFIVSILRILIVVGAAFISASLMELSTEGIVISLGSIAVAIGLALKDSFSNLANGVLIIINKPFRRGDHVLINGVEGKVHNIKLLTTELITFDNTKIVLPNNTVVNGNVINYSTLAIRRVDMKYAVSYDSDMDLVEKTLKEVGKNHPQVLKSMAVEVFMDGHEDSSIVYQVRVWANSADYFDIVHSFPRYVFDAFKKEGIEIPFNQLDVHFDNSKEKENA